MNRCASDCTCRVSELRPASKCLRKYGFYIRCGNKVRRYQCKICFRLLSFPPKKKPNRKHGGRPFSLLEKGVKDFYSWDEYCLVQVLGRASKVSGFDFYQSMERFTGLNRGVLAPRISRKLAFATKHSCSEVLMYYERFYLGMYKSKEKRRREKRWISQMRQYLGLRYIN